MNSALLLLSFSLLSWAWLLLTWLEAGVLLSLVLISRFTPWRWQITLNQFYRWGDLSSLLTVVLLIYVYILQPTDKAVFVLLKWLPMLFAPVLLAQLFSTGQRLPLGALFYSFRKRQQNREMDFQLPYTALVMLSTGAANVQDTRYFILAVLLFGSVLWTIRPKQQANWAWILMVSLAVFISYFAQQGLRRMQNIIEEHSVEWLSQWHTDPFKSHTSIGDLGELKLSDKIAFRVKAKQPLLLLQASYDLYLGKNWIVSKPIFYSDNPTKAIESDQLEQLEILQQFNQREEVLALPDGMVNITGMEGAFLQYSPLGAVKISDAPDFAQYQVFYTGKRSDTPSQYDVQIPKQHSDWLRSVTQELKLVGLKPEAIAATITTHFHRHFYYSLYLGAEADPDLALREFILKRKAGHCEYFAVASVLLLRQMGIPARLANGYAVEEYDAEQNLYLVRRRHAHAWAIAYINGLWQVVDSTPAQWLEMENEHASFWQPVNDWFSNRLFQFKQWQQQQGDKQNLLWLAAALLLTLYIAWRIYSAKQQLTRATHLAESKINLPDYPGMDSEFYLIEQQFLDTAQARAKSESMAQWVQRLQLPELNQLYQWHYQLRFDPDGIAPEQRQQLQQQVKLWLEKIRL
jgi:hypothetical protein